MRLPALVKTLPSCSLSITLAILTVTIGGFQPLYAQKNQGYIATDSSLMTGRISSLGKGRYEFRHHRKSKPVIFGANDIREYGDGGQEYESVLVGAERIFYQRIANGPVKFFKHKKSYFLSINDSLISVTRDNYRERFQQNLICEGGSHLIKTVSYNSRSMGNYVNVANRGKCTSANLPYRRIGFYAGYNLMTLDAEFDKVDPFSENTNSFTGGIFFDLPLYRVKSLFLSAEFLVTHLQTSYYKESGNRTQYAGFDMTGFIVPLGIKWYASKTNLKPYLKTGAVVSYLKFNSVPEYYATTTNGGVVEVLHEDLGADNSLQLGFDAAAGLEFPVGNRKNIHIECKYLNSFGVSADSHKVNCSGLFLMTGINF